MDFKGLLDDDILAGIDRDAGLQQALALIAASGPSTSPTNLGQILLQGNQVGQQARQQGLEGAMQRQKLLQDRQLQQQRKQLLGGIANSPNATQSALASGGGPTMANAEVMKQTQGANLSRMMDAYRQSLLLDDGGKTAEQIKGLIEAEKPKLEKLGKGEQLIDPATGRVVAQGAEDLPTAIREYNFAVAQGFKGSFNDYQTQLKRAGATNIGMPSIKIGNTFGEDVAKGIAGNVMGQVDAATAAANTVATVQSMRAALPKAITGTGANARIAWTRLAQTLGVGGKDDAESLASTSQLVQGLASAQLQMAQANKGQGTFTDFERGLLARAASGDINMTPAELNQLFTALEKGARRQYKTGSEQINRMREDPNFKMVSPYLQLPDLPSEQQNADPLGLRGQ